MAFPSCTMSDENSQTFITPVAVPAMALNSYPVGSRTFAARILQQGRICVAVALSLSLLLLLVDVHPSAARKLWADATCSASSWQLSGVEREANIFILLLCLSCLFPSFHDRRPRNAKTRIYKYRSISHFRSHITLDSQRVKKRRGKWRKPMAQKQRR